MLYNKKAVQKYIKDTKKLTKVNPSDNPKVSFSSDFWIGLDVFIRRGLDGAIRRSKGFRRMTAAELGFNSKLMKGSVEGGDENGM